MLKELNINNKNSLKVLKLFLNNRKSVQKNQTSIVSKIIKNVKIKGDKAVINYEKKFSKIKTKSNKLFFSNSDFNISESQNFGLAIFLMSLTTGIIWLLNVRKLS